MWCVPAKQDGAFVARMEQVLEVYARRYEARFPFVCMDEQPFQLLSERRRPVSLGKGRGRLVDDEYVREGSCTVWMFVGPLGGAGDREMHKRRNNIEWLFRRLKGFRRILSLFEKLHVVFLGFVVFALIVEALR